MKKALMFFLIAVLITTLAGQVVTAYSSAYFDEGIEAIVSLFYK